MSHKYPKKSEAPFDLEAYLTCEKHIELYLETVTLQEDPVLLQEALQQIALARKRMAEK